MGTNKKLEKGLSGSNLTKQVNDGLSTSQLIQTITQSGGNTGSDSKPTTASSDTSTEKK